MDDKLAAFLLAELAARPDSLEGLTNRLVAAGRIPARSERAVVLHLHALQREGKVRHVAAEANATRWCLVGSASRDIGAEMARVRQIRDAYGSGRRILEELQDIALTPAGNPRPASARVRVRWHGRSVDSRIEVVDEPHGERCFWLCVYARRRQEWTKLRATAETPSDGWLLPWRPASEGSIAPPALLAWRSIDLEGAVDAVVEVCQAMRLGSLSDSRVDRIELPKSAPTHPHAIDGDQKLIDRLVRRRGPAARGRRLPIRGTCDRCGQPLSDPFSLLVGIGPVCRTYYPSHVVAAVARTAVTGEPWGEHTRTPTDALLQLALAWAHDPSGPAEGSRQP